MPTYLGDWRWGELEAHEFTAELNMGSGLIVGLDLVTGSMVVTGILYVMSSGISSVEGVRGNLNLNLGWGW